VISCDTYYYGLATELGIDSIHRFLTKFNFGSARDRHRRELTGLAPSQEWKLQRFKQKWYAGDTVSVGIGQGYLLTRRCSLPPRPPRSPTMRPGPSRLLKAVQDSRRNDAREVAARNPDPVAVRPSTWLWCARDGRLAKPGHRGAHRGGRAYHRREDRHRAGDRMKQGERYDEKRVKDPPRP